VAIDQVERPTIMQKLVEAIGAEAVDFPYATECCGSFQAVGNPDFINQRAWEILSSAIRCGAEAIVLTCPLCHFNLSQRQPELVLRYSDFQGLPVFYFTQLLAIALGLDSEVCHFELSYGDPLCLLKSRELVS
jgi:heterodisulfide reductase subunit B